MADFVIEKKGYHINVNAPCSLHDISLTVSKIGTSLCKVFNSYLLLNRFVGCHFFCFFFQKFGRHVHSSKDNTELYQLPHF